MNETNKNDAIVLPVRSYTIEEIENEVNEDIKAELKVENEDIELDEDNAEFKCDGCGKDFIGNAALAKHQKEKHKHDNRKFVCQDCGKSFIGKKSLENHERSHKRVPCDGCDKLFSSKNLSKHRKKCQGKVEGTKEHVCEQCGYSTKEERFQKTIVSISGLLLSLGCFYLWVASILSFKLN